MCRSGPPDGSAAVNPTPIPGLAESACVSGPFWQPRPGRLGATIWVLWRACWWCFHHLPCPRGNPPGQRCPLEKALDNRNDASGYGQKRRPQPNVPLGCGKAGELKPRPSPKLRRPRRVPSPLLLPLFPSPPPFPRGRESENVFKHEEAGGVLAKPPRPFRAS